MPLVYTLAVTSSFLRYCEYKKGLRAVQCTFLRPLTIQQTLVIIIFTITMRFERFLDGSRPILLLMLGADVVNKAIAGVHRILFEAGPGLLVVNPLLSRPFRIEALHDAFDP